VGTGSRDFVPPEEYRGTTAVRVWGEVPRSQARYIRGSPKK